MAMGADNPFFYRGAIRRVEDFVGREAEINQILGLLRNGQSVSLIGPRRIGKSSLLLHLCHPAVRERFRLDPPRSLFVLLDCQEFAGSPPEEVHELLLDSLLEAAERAGLAIVESDLIGVELPDSPQPLLQVCTALLQAEVNITQVYPLLSRPHSRPAVALMVDNIEIALDTLANKGFTPINEDDLKECG